MRQTGDEAQRWDVFCRVIDNHGDLGVCWRLARRLAALGRRVRLWVDDAAALAWMAPGGAPGVELRPWRDPQPGEPPGDVVVEAFGCDPPPGFVGRMAAAATPPLWINLEYLSAEAYVERSHGLPSPQSAGPGAGLTKWFFYPGFTRATGGLLREPGLERERDAFEAAPWLASLGASVRPAARRVSLFCYEAAPALAEALEAWSAAPTELLVTPGPATRQVAARLGVAGEPGTLARRGALQAHFLPWLAQPDYDRLLWSCALNHVRGEDSLVRALWAARPFVWQLYPQHDGAHLAKLEAFLDLYLAGLDAATAAALRRRCRAWNGAPGVPAAAAGEPDPDRWHAAAVARSAALQAEATAGGDLAQRLCDFADLQAARAKRAG